MKPATASVAVALLATPSLLFGSSTPTPGKAAPAIVPYQCADGRSASVVYESGSDYLHARALVTFDGRTLEMRSAPTLYGVRYRSPAGAEGGSPLAWSLRGEEARLTESPDEESYAREEREIARCLRVRGAPSAEAAGEAPAGEHGEDH